VSSDAKIRVRDAETGKLLDLTALGTLDDEGTLTADAPVDTSGFATPGTGTTVTEVMTELEARIDALENP
jgi:hypothetical protein